MTKSLSTRELRQRICTPGYYEKRMKYCMRKEAVWARYVSKPNSVHLLDALKDVYRFNKKANWYRRRIGKEPGRDAAFVVELDRHLFPIPYYLSPAPYSLFPIPYPLKPIPSNLKPKT